MNDTILGERQKKIIKLLEKKSGLTRSELIKQLNLSTKVSRITQIRDLNKLISGGFIKTKGKARATKYYLTEENPLFYHVDIDNYFEIDAFEREAKTSFNKDIFKHLNSLYSKKEKNLWEKSSIEINKRTKQLDPSILKRELERFVIELSWKSSQIEGNTYSLIETEALIKQNIQAKGHPKDEAVMILNHKSAFDSIIKNKKTFQKISYSDIVQLHGILTRDLVSSGVRSQPVRISGSVYTPPSHKSELESLLRKIIRHINIVEYPPEKALIASVILAYLQPFADGNKRTSRMLANAILLSYGYFPLSYRSIDVSEYRKAIILFYEQNNLYHIKRLFMEQLVFAVGNYFRI